MSVIEQSAGGRSSWAACTGPVLVALGEQDELAGMAEHAVLVARQRRTRLAVVAVAMPAPIGMTISPQALPFTVASICGENVDRLDRRLARFCAAMPQDVALDHRVELGSAARVLGRVVAQLAPTAIVLGSLLDQRGVARFVGRSCRLGTDVHIAARRSIGPVPAPDAPATAEVAL